MTVVGLMATPVYTRQIEPESTEVESSGNLVKAVCMANWAVGGGRRNVYTRGVDGGVGVNDVCMLVTTCGRVTATGSDYLYLDDGSRPSDGSGLMGVRVSASELTIPPAGQYVCVTGLVNASRLSPPMTAIRLLIPRRQSDIRILGGVASNAP